MKKIVTIIAVATMMCTSASAQSFLSSLFGGSSSSSSSTTSTTAGDAISGILGAITGNSTIFSTTVTLDGTYSYSGCAIGLSSSNSSDIFANIGGSAVSATVESKVDEYLAKIGVKAGFASVTFNSSENTFSTVVKNIPLSGTYKIGDGAKTITFTFPALKGYTITGNLSASSAGATMLFPQKQALGLLKKVASYLGKSSSEVASLSKLLDGYDELKVGVKIVK